MVSKTGNAGKACWAQDGNLLSHRLWTDVESLEEAKAERGVGSQSAGNFETGAMTLDLMLFCMALRKRLLQHGRELCQWWQKRTLKKNNLMRRILQVSKGKIMSFSDKMECVLNFKRWSDFIHVVLRGICCYSSSGLIFARGTFSKYSDYVRCLFIPLLCLWTVLTIVITFLCILWADWVSSHIQSWDLESKV